MEVEPPFLEIFNVESSAAMWLHAPPFPATQLHCAITAMPSFLNMTYTVYVVFAFSDEKQCVYPYSLVIVGPYILNRTIFEVLVCL